MKLPEALRELICRRRENQIVVTTMGATREWPRLAQHPLDFHFIPSTMGGGLPLALGMALAQPEREVMVVSGDGALVMSLGALITIADSGVTNLTIVVIENGVYEVTGGQQTAAGHAVDYCQVAAGCGIPHSAAFSELAAWQAGADAALALPGPRLIVLRTEPDFENYLLDPPGPLAARLATFREALAATH